MYKHTCTCTYECSSVDLTNKFTKIACITWVRCVYIYIHVFAALGAKKGGYPSYNNRYVYKNMRFIAYIDVVQFG